MKTSISIFLAALMSQSFSMALAQNGNQQDFTETPIPMHVTYDMNEGGEMNSSEGQLVAMRFIVGFVHEYGYFFLNPDDLDHMVGVAFIDEPTHHQFEDSYWAESPKRVTGSIVYCDCVGELKENYGDPLFIVHQAHIVVQLP